MKLKHRVLSAFLRDISNEGKYLTNTSDINKYPVVRREFTKSIHEWSLVLLSDLFWYRHE